MRPKTLLLLRSLSYSTLKLTSLPCGKSTFSQAESKTNVLDLTSRKRFTFPLHDAATHTTYYRRPNHCRLVSFTKYCQQRLKEMGLWLGLNMNHQVDAYDQYGAENERNMLIAIKSGKDSVFKVRHWKTVLYRCNSGADRDMHVHCSG